MARLKRRLNLYLFITKITRLTDGQKSGDEACSRVPEVAGKTVSVCIGRFRIRKDRIINQASKNTNTQNFILWNAGEKEKRE